MQVGLSIYYLLMTNPLPALQYCLSLKISLSTGSLIIYPEISEDEAEDRLQEAIQEKFAVFGDVCLHIIFFLH